MAKGIREAGAVVMRNVAGAPHLLIVRSSDGTSWLFPKGHIEEGETAEEAALRETREEAGVVGRVLSRLGVSCYARGDKEIEVEFFLIEYRDTCESEETREQRWCTCHEAVERLSFENLRTLANLACRTARAVFGHPEPA